MSVSCECCVLSGRDLCDELIPRPEESCGVSQMCVIMKPRRNEEAQAHIGQSSHRKKMYIYVCVCGLWAYVVVIGLLHILEAPRSDLSPD
jgi:hypothetical protein